MLNHTFNATNIPQNQQQHTQNVLPTNQHHAHLPPHTSQQLLQTSPNAAALNYMQQLQQLQYRQAQQQSTAAAAPPPQMPQLAQFAAQQQQPQLLNTMAPQQQQQQQFVTESLLDKSYFTNANGQPNTILITNNFTTAQQQQPHQQQQQQQRFDGLKPYNASNNIRILSNTHAAMPQHMFGNINNNNNNNNTNIPKTWSELQQLYATRQLMPQQSFFMQQQQLQQSQPITQPLTQPAQQSHQIQQPLQQHSAAVVHDLLPTAANTTAPIATASYLPPQHFNSLNASPQQQHHHLQQQLQQQQQQQLDISSTPQYYMPAEQSQITPTKLIPKQATYAEQQPLNVISTSPPAPVTTSTLSPVTALPNNRSTVVLDRINICINNHHYTDANSNSNSISGDITGGGVGIFSPATSIATAHAQQPSPIIPAIQHKPIESFINSNDQQQYINNDAFISNDSNALVIDEPDSTTTTPHTPPTTPENSLAVVSTTSAATATVQSPSTTSTTGPLLEMQHIFRINDEEPAHASELSNRRAASLTPPPRSPTPPPPPIVIEDTEEPATSSSLTSSSSCSISTQIERAEDAKDAMDVIMQDSNANLPPTPPTPPAAPARTPTPPATPPKQVRPAFVEGEDVFIKRQDGRFYLGTVIDHARQQFLVRFDDKSELWCSTDEMKKLGGGGGGGCNSEDGDKESASKAEGMCVACKRTQLNDTIEKCERCGRGYHRNCTTETSPGSGDYMCKRCAKPMKVGEMSMLNAKKASVCRQLPYHVETLNWDDKHRVNEEQIYCYCGKTGKFDQNMLQCCKCSNWFHTHCMQDFKTNILRGDGFFVFCCSVCNDGVEFLRRLQMSWLDVMHLTLYNLSAMKKHQHHKYHHLIKDIHPFVLEKRHSFPIPKQWMDMTESSVLETIKKTLNVNTERFMCGREIKRDYYYYALRVNGPPILPRINIKASDVLNDELLVNTLKLTLHQQTTENKTTTNNRTAAKPTPASKGDVYEFRGDDDEVYDDTEDLTQEDSEEENEDNHENTTSSEDEIPIQQILDKAKKQKEAAQMNNASSAMTASNEKLMDINDENANDATTADLQVNKNIVEAAETAQAAEEDRKTDDNSSTPSPTPTEHVAIKSARSSRKRKAFTLSKPYHERAMDGQPAKPYDVLRLCDLSSDENSSSSRGTSLDLIIPPPKNFLGSNNPFRMLTLNNGNNNGNGGATNGNARRNTAGGAGNISGSVIKSSIFNTTTLDFSSKLAALKSAGIFPNLSTSNLAKAAGQPRTVRTIKRRLSAKDITIGPNQEVRRRRIKRSMANVEVISTTTINPIPSTFFSLYAKDLKQTTLTTTTTTCVTKLQPTSSALPIEKDNLALSLSETIAKSNKNNPQHGRRLRERPSQKTTSPDNSRRSSISSSSSSSLNATQALAANELTAGNGASTSSSLMQDFKQTVNDYFGVVNRIESGEQYKVTAKRQLANGKTEFLLEWGDATTTWCSPNK